MSLINIAEAARVAGCSDKTLRRAIDEGKLKVQPRKVPNHPIMVDVEDLQAYLAERRGVQVEVMEVKVSPLPVKEKPSRSGSDSALVDRITELERLVQELLVDHRGDITELNVLLSHAEDQQHEDTGLAARVTELEQLIRQMQEEHESERLLGSGRDPLALGPMDDAHYENRMDSLEAENTQLSGLVVALRDALKEALVRLGQLEKDQAMDIATLTGQVERIDAKIGARLDHDSKRITDLVDRVAHLELSARYGDKPDTREVDAFFERNPGMDNLVKQEMERMQSTGQAKPVRTYEGEWTIVNDSGEVKYHGIDGSQARGRLDDLTITYPKIHWSLVPPVFTPSSGTATETTEGLPEGAVKQLKLSTGEVILFWHDFALELQEGYRCEARHEDVQARCSVQPYRPGQLGMPQHGDYVITQTHWEKIKQTGKEGPKQIKRAQFLLATLVDRVQAEMRKNGWVEQAHKDGSPVTIWRKV